MEKIIQIYLSKQYFLTVSGNENYYLVDKLSENNIPIGEITKELCGVFSMNSEELFQPLIKWIERENVLLNNKIFEIQEKLWQKDVELKLTNAELDNLIFVD